jgi:Tol biopolymer transport system component/DNA-binding winged helix-turn-helix (wHTH) protein
VRYERRGETLRSGELVRARRLYRRAARILIVVSRTYSWDSFVLDVDDFRLEHAGVPVPLEPKAFLVLVCLLERHGQLVTKQELFDQVWPDTAVTDHALTRVIAQLRRALGDEARESTFIETVPTRGYRWIRPLASLANATSASSLVPDALPAPAPATVPVTPGSDATAPSGRFTTLMVVLVVLVVALAATAWSQRNAVTTLERPARHSVMWPVQITTGAGLDLQPALAPAGDAIAYVSDRSGALEIYIRALDETATDTPLTADGGENVQPAWSPDGRYIAYHSYKHGGVWIVPARGGMPRQVAAQGSKPDWSPDGRRLVFQSDEPADVTPSAWGAQLGSTLWLVNADGSDLKPITTSVQAPGGHAAPVWSRSGRFIAFAVFEAGSDNGIWMLDVDTLRVQPLVRGPGLYELVFAADDRAIYAAGGEAFLLRVPVDPKRGIALGGRELIPVAGIPGLRGLSITGDGRMLAFAGLSLSSQIWMQPVNERGVRAGDARPITSDTSRRNSLATMSPDGTRVAYMSTRGGAAPDVWVINPDGSNAQPLTSDEASDGKPMWFPDSRRVAYMSNRADRLGIWAVDIGTRRHELLFDNATLRDTAHADDLGRLAELHVAPSMQRIAYVTVAPVTARRRLNVATLSPFLTRPVTDGSESVGYPAWSPNERHIAVEIKDGSSMHAGVVELESGVVRRLTNERGQSWVRSWSPDSRRIAMAASRAGRWDLRWVDIETGEQQIITPPLPVHMYARYPEWSARGDVVLFERGELRGNIWTLRIDQ